MVQSQHSHRPPLRTVLETYTAITGATYTAKAGDRVIGVNRAGAVTITLPSAEVRKGRVYTIKDESGAASSNNITLDTEGAETIDGSATDVINVNYESKSYYSDGTNWFILPITPDTNTQLTLSTTVSTQAHGDSAAAGSATTASKGDHKHAMPAALALSTTVSTQAHGDSSDAGSASDASKGDHKHAMPAAGGISQSTQSALEAETNENTYAPPDLIKHSPGVCKVWCHVTATGTLSSPDYGVSTVTDVGVGDHTVNFTTSFSTAIYAPVSTGDGIGVITWDSLLVGSISLNMFEDLAVTRADRDHSFQAFGDL